MSNHEKPADNINNTAVRFGDFEFNFHNKHLVQKGKIIPLQHKPSELLSLLLQSGGRVVNRNEIIEKIWGSQIVDFDQNINFCIKCIRKALNDEPKNPQFVQTIPRKGYQFIAEVSTKSAIPDHNNQRKISKYLPIFILLMVITSATLIYTHNKTTESSMPLYVGSSKDAPVGISSAERDIKRAWYLLDKGDLQSVKRSSLLFKKITEKTHTSGAAWAGLSIATLLSTKSLADKQLTTEYAKRAFKQSPENANSNLANGMVAFYIEWNIPKAIQYFENATQIDNKNIRAWHELSVVQTISGDHQQALNSIEAALDIDPGRVQEIFHSGWFYMATGNHPAALKQCEKSVELEPFHWYSRLCIITMTNNLKLHQKNKTAIMSFLQDAKASKTLIEQITRTNTQQANDLFHQWHYQFLFDQGANPFNLAVASAQMGQNTLALSWLQTAIDQRHSMVPTAWAYGEFENLRKTEAFQKMMNEVVIKDENGF